MILMILLGMRIRVAHSTASISRDSVHILGLHDITITASSENPSNRCGLKSVERFPKLAIQITAIVVVYQLGVIDKDDNGRGSRTDLVAVINLCLRSISACRWWLPQDGIPKYFIQHRSGNSLAVRTNGFVNHIVDLIDTLSSGCGNK